MSSDLYFSSPRLGSGLAPPAHHPSSERNPCRSGWTLDLRRSDANDGRSRGLAVGGAGGSHERGSGLDRRRPRR